MIVKLIRSEASSSLSRNKLPVSLIGAALCYSIALFCTISGESLTTDEAFSAYIASHRSIGSLFATLAGGDSSDLQTAMYYLYLHGWTVLFGASEFALRASNVPFILVFCFSLVWVSRRVFRSNWSWIAPAFLPFVWSYAREARAYFDMLALSTVCLGSLLVYLDQPSPKERRYLPWVVLSTLFVGTTFHMLMLLLLAPLLAVAVAYHLRRADALEPTDWKPALKFFSLPFAVLAIYLAWTFLRGTAYGYEAPGLLSMGSVFYRFVGLSGFGPDRHYDVSFRLYTLPLAASTLVLLIAAVAMAVAARSSGQRLRLLSLWGAFVLAMTQVVVLSVILKEQLDLRHLAALEPILLLALIAVLSPGADQRVSTLALGSAFLLGSLWMVGDLRTLLLPEYGREDFRSAIGQAIELKRHTGGEIALVADPAAGAYYGLDLQGDAPCFPLADSCTSGFRKVYWKKEVPAAYAALWQESGVRKWAAAVKAKGLPMIVIISQLRHPMYKNSAWWPFLRSERGTVELVHGFSIYLIR
jgi:hypothetical protein